MLEAQEHREVYIPDALGIPCTVLRMDSSDYAFLDAESRPTGIERCEIGNFIQKVRSGELEQQLYRCQEAFESTILLIEGVFDEVDGLLAVHKGGDRGYFRIHVYPHTNYEFEKAVEVRLSGLGIEVFHAANFNCSMSVIRAIYKQRTKPEEKHTLFKKSRTFTMPTKLSANPSVAKLIALCDRMPEKVAVRLILHYTSIWNVIHAPDKELMEIEGFGKGMVKRLRESIGRMG